MQRPLSYLMTFAIVTLHNTEVTCTFVYTVQSLAIFFIPFSKLPTTWLHFVFLSFSTDLLLQLSTMLPHYGTMQWRLTIIACPMGASGITLLVTFRTCYSHTLALQALPSHYGYDKLEVSRWTGVKWVGKRSRPTSTQLLDLWMIHKMV